MGLNLHFKQNDWLKRLRRIVSFYIYIYSGNTRKWMNESYTIEESSELAKKWVIANDEQNQDVFCAQTSWRLAGGSRQCRVLATFNRDDICTRLLFQVWCAILGHGNCKRSSLHNGNWCLLGTSKRWGTTCGLPAHLLLEEGWETRAASIDISGDESTSYSYGPMWVTLIRHVCKQSNLHRATGSRATDAASNAKAYTPTPRPTVKPTAYSPTAFWLVGVVGFTLVECTGRHCSFSRRAILSRRRSEWRLLPFQ
jgi:hypothetical protein